MQQMLTFNHRAMGTLFEAMLIGDDEEHLTAVASALWDEVDRIERLLSRFDPASEISRINRSASHEPVLVDREVFGILQRCNRCWQRTSGYFDVTLGRGAASRTSSESEDQNGPLLLDPDHLTVRFNNPEASLDLGGFGKGYALDRLGLAMPVYRIESALIHAGTSSVFALGRTLQGEAWPVGIRSPFGDRQEIVQVRLTDCGLSCSEALPTTGDSSDIIDPQTRQSLIARASCVVLTPTALEAEILSTALLAMGKMRAIEYIKQYPSHSSSIAWIDTDSAELQWLTRAS